MCLKRLERGVRSPSAPITDGVEVQTQILSMSCCCSILICLFVYYYYCECMVYMQITGRLQLVVSGHPGLQLRSSGHQACAERCYLPSPPSSPIVTDPVSLLAVCSSLDSNRAVSGFVVTSSSVTSNLLASSFHMVFSWPFYFCMIVLLILIIQVSFLSFCVTCVYFNAHEYGLSHYT